jgi:hypothetical protein
MRNHSVVRHAKTNVLRTRHEFDLRKSIDDPSNGSIGRRIIVNHDFDIYTALTEYRCNAVGQQMNAVVVGNANCALRIFGPNQRGIVSNRGHVCSGYSLKIIYMPAKVHLMRVACISTLPAFILRSGARIRAQLEFSGASWH